MQPPQRRRSLVERKTSFLGRVALGCGLAALLAGPAEAQDMPAGHGTAMSAPLFVQDLPVGTVSIRLARPSMAEAIVGVPVVATWTLPGGKQGTATVASGEDGRAIFGGVPPGAVFSAKAQVDGEALATTDFTVPAEGGTKLLMIVGAEAAAAIAGMANPHGQPGGGMAIALQAGKVATEARLPAGTVEIRVLGADGKPVPALHVDLAGARKGGGGIDVKRAETDTDGVARFTELERVEGRQWAAVVQHDGLRIGSELFALDAKHGSAGELRIPQRTRDLSVLRISATSRVMVEPREEAIAFLQNLVLENTSDMVFDPGPDGLQIPMPHGCVGTETLAGGVEVTIKDDVAAVLRAQVPPTPTPDVAPQIRVGCMMAARAVPEVELVQVLPIAMQGGVAMVPSLPSVALSAPGLVPRAAERDGGGNELRMYAMAALPAGQPLRLVVYGLPTRGQAGKWIVGILSGLLVVAGVAMARRPRQPPTGG
jgi:hypothetical protein